MDNTYLASAGQKIKKSGQNISSTEKDIRAERHARASIKYALLAQTSGLVSSKLLSRAMRALHKYNCIRIVFWWGQESGMSENLFNDFSNVLQNMRTFHMTVSDQALKTIFPPNKASFFSFIIEPHSFANAHIFIYYYFLTGHPKYRYYTYNTHKIC